ncbi:hypothetical protein [Granulicella tundricola]|uniref:hypothetical protein n=1 Tax=Granulicella tundricola TaxID=940615 RepID=UPI0001DB7A5D|nr:hypothetical protein [Granulicella tundricola]
MLSTFFGKKAIGLCIDQPDCCHSSYVVNARNHLYPFSDCGRLALWQLPQDSGVCSTPRITAALCLSGWARIAALDGSPATGRPSSSTITAGRPST